MRNALVSPAAGPSLEALARLIENDPEREAFTTFVDALEALAPASVRLVTWPIVTVAPFLARPDRFLFVKPTPTRQAARALGVELLYNSRPTWDVYERILEWSHALLRELRPYGARDLIDVQSFIWAIAPQTEKP